MMQKMDNFRLLTGLYLQLFHEVKSTRNHTVSFKYFQKFLIELL